MPRGVYDHKPKAVTDYILTHASEDLTRREVFQYVRDNICSDITYEYTRCFYYRNGLPYKKSKHTHNMLLTDEQTEWLVDYVKGSKRSSAEIVQTVKEKFGVDLTIAQIRGWKKNHKAPSGYDTRYRKGRISERIGQKWDDYMSKEGQMNSLKTCFGEGHIPANHKEVGTIVYRPSSGYYWIKVLEKPAKWKLLQRYIWELANGPVPKGYRLMFLDGNTANCNLENLQLVTLAVAGTAATRFKLTDDAEINKAIFKAAELKLWVANMEKKFGDKHNGSAH